MFSPSKDKMDDKHTSLQDDLKIEDNRELLKT